MVRRNKQWIVWVVAYVVWLAVLWFALPLTAQAAWPRLAGKASVFGNDPVQGFHDHQDSGITALGTPTAWGGIAVYRTKTLGGYWRVCAPRRILARGTVRCHTLRQTDVGPAPWTGRVVDITSGAARRAWRLRVRAFPTDVGSWTLRYVGRRQRGRTGR